VKPECAGLRPEREFEGKAGNWLNLETRDGPLLEADGTAINK